MYGAQGITGQQWQQQQSNSPHSQINFKESAILREKKPLFPINYAIKNSRRGFLLFIIIGVVVVLMFSIITFIKFSEISEQMQSFQKQIFDLREDINSKSDKEIQNKENSINKINRETTKIQQELIKQNQDYLKKELIQIKDFNIQQIQTLKDNLTSFGSQQEQIKINLASLPGLLRSQIELNSTVINMTKELDELKKYYQVISQLSNNLSVLSSETKRSQQDINELQQSSSKIVGIQVNVDNLKGALDKVQTQQQSLISSSSNPSIYNIDNQISAIKTDIQALQSQIPFAGVLPTIEHYGPYISTNWIMYIIATDTGMAIYPTTEPCIITVHKRALIILTATGGAKSDAHVQMTFLQDRKISLEKTGKDQRYYGTLFVFLDWVPVSLTQEFYVEAGTYEFTLGMNAIIGQHTIETQSISFVAKVQYSEWSQM